jgi:hypothetical protein
MPITLNGTTGIVGPDGSAASPAIQGADANTGMFFPAADTVAIATGGTEAMRVDSSRRVGIGTSSPSQKFVVANSNTDNIIMAENTGNAVKVFLQADTSVGKCYTLTNHPLALGANNTEYARIDTSGNLLVGTTTDNITATGIRLRGDNIQVAKSGDWSLRTGRTSSTGIVQEIYYNSSRVGDISTNGTGTSYNSASDYRLKNTVAPMTGALAKVAALKPVTYKWNADDSNGEGFIAHELAEVVPDAVRGTKDEVDAEGNPVYQSIDTSVLVATLTAAIQEQQALIAALQADVAALKGQA